ncbi:MAG: DUF2480 family protein [Bacteroidetes bacterium]|jgi:hypothetical protein|nr:MAG: hypothetical protein ABR80_00645 [Cryomorphaceae bacterium BACL11 MAG-121015-bin20]KRO70872.1 MAG: hypothetical protein ABR81_01105 [Cryomorphaceae bacterium BACL11 MAG-121128-bin16]MDA0889756.1 DUF2480 family protein [Bacteroidota bacterium]
MSEEIINRVANSDLITIDLTDYAPNIQILELDLKHFLFEGFILKEKDFRASLKEFDFSGYENKVVAVFCSSDCIIPMWAFMLVTSCLNNVASEIYSGNKNTVFQQLFLSNIENIKTLKFKNKKVIVKGCGQIPLSANLYVAITKKLQNIVTSLMFGEACSAVPVFKKQK